MEQVNHEISNQFYAALRGLVEIAEIGGNERELMFAMASIMQYELSGGDRSTRKYPYARSLEMIMRAVMFVFRSGNLDNMPMDDHEQGYLANKLLDNGVPDLLKSAGYTKEMLVRSW